MENRERMLRKLAREAELPTSGRGSASHWRHSDVLDWDVPPAGGGSGEDVSDVGLTGGRQHKESRRQALVFDKLRNSVRQIQEQRDSAGPVRVCGTAAPSVQFFFSGRFAFDGKLMGLLRCPCGSGFFAGMS